MAESRDELVHFLNQRLSAALIPDSCPTGAPWRPDFLHVDSGFLPYRPPGVWAYDCRVGRDGGIGKP